MIDDERSGSPLPQRPLPELGGHAGQRDADRSGSDEPPAHEPPPDGGLGPAILALLESLGC